MTLTTGAKQFVVQDAFVTSFCSSLRRLWLQPSTTFKHSGSLTGADTTTRLTPHSSKYGERLLTLRNLPISSNET